MGGAGGAAGAERWSFWERREATPSYTCGAKEAVREELAAHLGPRGGARGPGAAGGRGDHDALEGVLASEADRIAVTQAHLFVEAERTGDPTYEQRGRALHVPLHDARVAEEDRALERENEERRALGLGERGAGPGHGRRAGAVRGS